MPSHTRVLLFAAGVAVLAAIIQLVLRPLFDTAGLFRPVSPLGNQDCKVEERLRGCEDIILDDKSGVLYLSCGDPENSWRWTPYTQTFQESMRPETYLATYNPDTARLTRLAITGYPSARPMSFHGIDVVRSAADPQELFVYAVNHRAPLPPADARTVGADSCIEIFRMREGADTLMHVATVEDPRVILTPNDVVGSPDGKSVWFTNDHATKMNTLYRQLELILGLPVSTVGYCHVEHGCKVAAGGLVGVNGIVRHDEASDAETFFVSSSMRGVVYALSKQPDNTLVVTDKIPVGLASDNLSVDRDGAVWVASFPKGLAIHARARNLSSLAPSAAFRISVASNSAGDVHCVDRMFEDDGSLAAVSTIAVHDTRRHLLYLNSAFSAHLTICKI